MTHVPKELDDELAENGGLPVTIAEAKSEFEANLIVSTLAEEGIEAHTYTRFRQALPFHSHFSGIPVQVRAADEIAAREALDRRAADSVDLDWNELDVGEREDHLPLGRSRRLSLATAVALSMAIVVIFITLIAMILSVVL